MAPFIAQRYEVFVAEEGTYGEFSTQDSLYREIRPEAEGFEHEGKTEILERAYIRADLGNSPGLPGAKSCKVKLSLPARGGGYSAGSDVDSKLCPELECLLKTCLASLNEDTGIGLSGGGAYYVTTDDGTPSNYLTLGGLVFIDPDGAGGYEARWISKIDDESDSFHFAGDWLGASAWNLSGTPTANGVAYSAVQGNSGTEALASASMEISGIIVSSEQPVWRYSGLVGNLKIKDGNSQKRVMLDFDLVGDGYDVSDGPQDISIAGGAGEWPSDPTDLRALSADFRINGSRTAYRSFSLDLGNAWSEILDSTEETGRSGYALTKVATGGSMVVYWDDSYHTKLAEGERIDISWVLGGPDNGIGFHAPYCEIRSLKETQINGLLAIEIQFVCLPSSLDGIPDWTLAFAGTTGE